MADHPELPSSEVYVDECGREFHYVWIDNGSTQLGVHFSAFFGDWGDDPKYRATFGGYFHRLKMLGSDRSLNWLFLCDAFGADSNGTYYTGLRDDLFVERAVRHILRHAGLGTKYRPADSVMLGSSMGATAALKFGIEFGVAGIMAISPHIDLDTSARLQGRERHVSWILGGGDTQAIENRWLTRQVSLLIQEASDKKKPLPTLFIQSCKDDHGVHYEQVEPMITMWNRSGDTILDVRAYGGHTSEYATRSLILDVIHCLLNRRPISTRKYKWNPKFRPYSFSRGAYLQLRRRGARVKAKFLSHQHSEP